MPIPKKVAVPVPKTAKERIYTELKEWIIDGTLKPGEKISDQEISQYFSVSRTPVREALQMLSDQKLVDIFPGRETRVGSLDIATAYTTYRIAAELHALAVELSYEEITNKTIQNLKKYNERFNEALKNQNNEEAYRYDQKFHNVFLDLADDYFLKEFSQTLENHIQRIEHLYFIMANGESDSYSVHQNIITALENKDMESAKEYMRKNWLHTIEVFHEKQPD